MATAREAVSSTLGRLSALVEAKPQAPSASTRTPSPKLSLTLA